LVVLLAPTRCCQAWQADTKQSERRWLECAWNNNLPIANNKVVLPRHAGVERNAYQRIRAAIEQRAIRE